MIEDVEFPQSEIGIPRPLVGHPANLTCLGEIRRLSRQDKRIDKKTLYF